MYVTPCMHGQESLAGYVCDPLHAWTGVTSIMYVTPCMHGQESLAGYVCDPLHAWTGVTSRLGM